MESRERILELQRDFEQKKITEEDMTAQEIEELNKLYDEQISLLTEMEDLYKKKLENYKNATQSKLKELSNLKK